MTRRRDESGSALIEFSWLGIILLVPLIWIVISVFQVQQGAFATSAAARAAGRAFALAPDDATGTQRANAAAAQVMADQGRPGQTATLTFKCSLGEGNCHVGTAVITVIVNSSVALPMSPKILNKEATTFSLTSTHTVPFGQFVESGADDDDDDGGRGRGGGNGGGR